MNQDLLKIVSLFQVEGIVQEVVPLDEGFINDTYFVNIKGEKEPGYILQRKNKYVFKDVPSMMQNIDHVTNHLKRVIKERGGDPLRESLTITPTLSNELYYKDDQGEFWAMCLFIKGSLNYQTVNTPDLAYSGGKAIGMFQSMLSGFTTHLVDILPGFHNIRFRFKQWEEALAANAARRVKNLKQEIEWIESRRKEMMDFYELLEKGEIPQRVSHNDTKISNVLFDKNGDVLCLIDLDTVLSSTVLNDFGDAIRTYANTGEEDDADLNNVSLDLTFYEAFARGYLEHSVTFLTQSELEYLAFSAKYITFEQTMRFLMDYIDGDKYYKIKSPEHNLQRTYAQFKLLQSMESNYSEMMRIIKNLAAKAKA